MLSSWKTGAVLFVAFLFAFLDVPSQLGFPNLLHSLKVNENPKSTEEVVQTKLLQMLHNAQKPNCSIVAVGYNSNLDLIVNAIEVFKELNLNGTDKHKDVEKISSLEELEQVFTHYFEKGAAAERFVAQKETWSKILEASKRERIKQSWFIGGNAALMANRFASEGCQSILLGGGPVGSMLSSLLHPSIHVVKNQLEVEDEVHLILEYDKFASFGKYSSPRANRFILHSDQANAKLTGMPLFHSHLYDSANSPSNAPSVIVLSGFHLLDGQDEQERAERLTKVEEMMKDEKIKNIPIHVELASIADLRYMSQLLTFVLPNTDSLGLNEQELGSTYLAIHNGEKKYSRDHFKEPNLSTVFHTIKNMFSFAQTNSSPDLSRKLSRIHFHCLAYHVIAQKTSSKWNNTSQAVVAGSIAASSQACNLQDVDLQILQFLDVKGLSFDPNNPLLTWQEEDLIFYISPVLVCKRPQKTVGLGDSISAVGLIHQVFSNK